MLYKLFHKNIEVLTIEYEKTTNKFGEIKSILNKDHIPVGLTTFKNYTLQQAIQFWWQSRLIPKDRNSRKTKDLDIDIMTSNSYGFNLTDHYWIKSVDSRMTWKKGNFFLNDFDENVGKYLLGEKKSFYVQMNSDTPDLFSNGQQDKRWIIDKTKRKLIKYGSAPYYEQPFNEVLATEICRRLGFLCTKYKYVVKGKLTQKYYSLCDCFADENIEFIPAGFIECVSKRQKGVSLYNHLLNCCKELGMKNIEKIEVQLCQMMLLDYIIANTDRHFANFGFLRDSKTLEWKGFVPIFDSGNSMFFDCPTSDLRKSLSIMENVECKSFAKTQKLQLKKFAQKISALKIDFSTLDGIDEFYKNILSQNLKCDEERRTLLAQMLKQRIIEAQNIIYSKNEVIKQFLTMIEKDKTKKSFFAKVNLARKAIELKSPENKKLLENYLRQLNAVDPIDLKKVILNQVLFCNVY